MNTMDWYDSDAFYILAHGHNLLVLRNGRVVWGVYKNNTNEREPLTALAEPIQNGNPAALDAASLIAQARIRGDA